MEYSNNMSDVSSIGFSHPLSSPEPAPKAQEAEAQSTEQETVQNNTGSVGTASPVTDSQNQVDFFA